MYQLYKASKNDSGQFESRRYITEVIYSGSDQGSDFRIDKTWQAGTVEAWNGREATNVYIYQFSKENRSTLSLEILGLCFAH